MSGSPSSRETRTELPLAPGEHVVLRLATAEPPDAARPAVLYLHGFGSSQDGDKAEFFRARAVAAHIPFASIDFRGHGASGGNLRDVTLSRNLEDVAAAQAFLARLGYRRLVLFGSSMGAATALWHAVASDGIAGLVLIAPAIGLRRGLERWAGDEGLVRWERDGAIRYRSELVESDLGWTLMADLRRYELGDLARALRVPALVFQGERDASVDWHDVAGFVADCEALRPGAVTLRLFPDGDHRLTDRLDLLWDEAERFIDRL